MRRLGGFSGEEDGQTVVIVALMFTLLLGFSALAIDVGLYYAERRGLQDAVDAAALACVRAYSQGGATSATAYAAAEDILENYNLKGSLSGVYDDYQVPALDGESYYDNIRSGPYLKDGVLPQLSPYTGCRVAVYVEMPTTLIKIANPSLQTLALTARAYAIAKAGMVPVVVPKYSNGPGPGTSDGTGFIHHTMAQGSDYQCTTTSDSGCTAASTTTKGREFILFGTGQEAVGFSSFKGYIAPDVRDFQTNNGAGSLIHTSYNGVAADADINTLKDFEANWIDQGYPGPDLCTVSSTNFLPCAQVAIISGASAGIFIDHLANRYVEGDKILAQLYDGTVKKDGNFTMSFDTLTVPSATGTLGSQNVSFTFGSAFQSSGAQVDTTFYADDGTITKGAYCSSCGDTLNPWHPNTTCACSATSGTFATDPTPQNQASYTQTWSNISTTSAPKGIYAVFLQGVAGAPLNGLTQTSVVTVNVRGQDKQFYINTSDAYKETTAGTNAAHTIRVTDGNGQSAWNGGANSITLAIDQCPKSGSTTLTCYFGTPGVQSLTTSVDVNSTLTVEVPSSTTTNTTYTGWIRASGFDSSGAKVTRVLKISTAVSLTEGGTTNYIDVLGFAVFEITDIQSNKVLGKAVTGYFTSMSDPALAIGKKYGLVPWETN